MWLIHQLVAALDVALARRQRFQDEKLGDRQLDRLGAPGAQMAPGIEQEIAALDHRLGIARRLVARQLAAPQEGADALDQQALREGLLDIVVGAHPEAEQLVDLVVLRGQEDDRHCRRLAQLGQELHAVHARHLDVEDGEIDGLGADRAQRLGAIGIAAHGEAFGLERDRYRGQDITVIVDQGDGVGHGIPSRRAAAGSIARAGRKGELFGRVALSCRSIWRV